MWAEPVLRTARRLRSETGVVFASVAMGALAIRRRGQAIRRRRADCRSCRDTARRPARSARWSTCRASAPGRCRALPPHPNRARGAPPPPRDGRSARRGAAREAARALRRSTAEGAHGRVGTLGGRRPRARIGFPVAVKALAPELPHKAKLGGVRLGLADPTDVEVAAAEVLRAARRAGAGVCPRARPGDGDGHRGARRRRGRRRASAPASRCGRAARSRKRARRCSSPRPLTRGAGAGVRALAGRAMRAGRMAATICAAARPGGRRRSRAPRTTSAAG